MRDQLLGLIRLVFFISAEAFDDGVELPSGGILIGVGTDHGELVANPRLLHRKKAFLPVGASIDDGIERLPKVV